MRTSHAPKSQIACRRELRVNVVHTDGGWRWWRKEWGSVGWQQYNTRNDKGYLIFLDIVNIDGVDVFLVPHQSGGPQIENKPTVTTRLIDDATEVERLMLWMTTGVWQRHRRVGKRALKELLQMFHVGSIWLLLPFAGHACSRLCQWVLLFGLTGMQS